MSRKKISFRERDVGGPPEHSAWVWHTHELKRSDAWRYMSPSLSRLLNELELEHLRHERLKNGELELLYDDMMRQARISRGLIRQTIAEGVRRGLLRVTKEEVTWPLPPDGKRPPNRYRLTYLPCCMVDEKTKVTIWHRETNEWRSYVEPQRAKREPPKRAPKSISTPPKVVPTSVPSTVLGSEEQPRETAKNQVPSTVPNISTVNGTSYKDLGVSAPSAPRGSEPPPSIEVPRRRIVL
ncbi:MAG: hypothetical protein ACM3JG_18795 [Thiohalocapsa sp.]